MIEYEIKKPFGKVKISVDVYFDFHTVRYTVRDVLTCAKGKRKYHSIASAVRDRYEYRLLDFEGKEQYAKAEFLKVCTEDDIATALRIAYEKMKPNEKNTAFRVI